jgi:YesN/AraC family two-component response regulator
MFFQSTQSLTENEFWLSSAERLSFPIHIHRSFEYFKQIRGCTQMMIGDQTYVLQSGDAVLVFPMQPHSYTSIETGEIQMAIFSPDMVSSFYKANHHKLPTSSKFHCELPENATTDTFFHQKSLAYFICGEFDRGREYVEGTGKRDEQLLISLLLFADKNFHNRCLLQDAAAEIGYDYAYISKFFKRGVGTSFRQYVNRLRITESKQLLKQSAKSIDEISAMCGFASVRAFDREFRAQTGLTPSNYKKMKANAAR